VVSEEDYRTVANSGPVQDPLHLQWAVSVRACTRRIASNDRHRILVTAELEQWLHYNERYTYDHLGRHDELCHLPRAFDLIQEHYLSRLHVLERNDQRAREEIQELTQQLERDVARQAAGVAARMAVAAAAAAQERANEVVTIVATADLFGSPAPANDTHGSPLICQQLHWLATMRTAALVVAQRQRTPKPQNRRQHWFLIPPQLLHRLQTTHSTRHKQPGHSTAGQGYCGTAWCCRLQPGSYS
jgi:hypothetical protein